jgi:hypothetical protein
MLERMKRRWRKRGTEGATSGLWKGVHPAQLDTWEEYMYSMLLLDSRSPDGADFDAPSLASLPGETEGIWTLSRVERGPSLLLQDVIVDPKIGVVRGSSNRSATFRRSQWSAPRRA